MPLPLPGTYNENIPQPTDTLNQSQLDFLNNFGANYNLLSYDDTGAFLSVGGHGAFDSVVPGQHVYIQMPNMTSIGFTVAAAQNNEIDMYAKTSLTNETDLFIQLAANSTKPGNQLIPITASNYASPGWAYLPSGILLKWGSATVATNALVTETFPVGPTIPVFNTCFNVLLTVGNGNAADQNTAVQLGNITNVDFNVRTTSRNGGAAAANTTFYYLALGI